ncbi:MAG: 2-oxoacid:acceptor oxidoreductase subunit alpha [Bdellovibrionales bacterium]|nr:2-oxoacid:acceptor oxidoreductase subunit alpha [Bdellovibrionales bacterium]
MSNAGLQSDAKKIQSSNPIPLEQLEHVTIRFAGDSGDGMQLTGNQFTNTSAFIGNDVSTFPDFPAEIRAPAGSLPGVSGFQIHFSSKDIRTAGDTPNVLVAMNPAALKVHLKDLEKGGMVIINSSAFTKPNLKKAGYETNPLEDKSLDSYRVFDIPLTKLNEDALSETSLSKKEIDRCKNFFALGIMYWLYDRPLEITLDWIEKKFKNKPEIIDANQKALKSGYYFGETSEIFTTHYHVDQAQLPQGTYRQVTGNRAIALGLVAGAQLAGKPLFYGSYPITPASDILHELSNYKNFDVRTFQAEDEIAAIGVALGASFGGHLGVTGTSGPGVALKAEFMGLAVMTELPLVIVNVMRAGPSTGMPTKTEQTDLFQALYGRNGECPMVVLAPSTPSDCFTISIEAMRIATKYMVPVIILSDNTLANGAEPWKIPHVDEFPKFEVNHLVEANNFLPYQRNEKTLARPWVAPGTKGLEHRIGGIEKQDLTGNVSYDPQNHEKMIRLRAEKVQRVAQEIAPLEISGPEKGDTLLVGWGSTYGAIASAADQLREEGLSVSNIHIRHLSPLPSDLGDIMKRFKNVIIAECNTGQLRQVIRGTYLVDAKGINKIQGQPLKISEIKSKVKEMI